VTLVGGVVDLVEQDAEVGHRVVDLSAAPQLGQRLVEGAERGLVIPGHLEGGHRQQQVGTEFQELPLDGARGDPGVLVQVAVGQVEKLDVGDTEKFEGIFGLPAPPFGVLLAVFNHLVAAARVGQKEDPKLRARGRQLAHQATAAQDVVVGVGRQHEHPSGVDFGRVPRQFGGGLHRVDISRTGDGPPPTRIPVSGWAGGRGACYHPTMLVEDWR